MEDGAPSHTVHLPRSSSPTGRTSPRARRVASPSESAAELKESDGWQSQPQVSAPAVTAAGAAAAPRHGSSPAPRSEARLEPYESHASDATSNPHGAPHSHAHAVAATHTSGTGSASQSGAGKRPFPLVTPVYSPGDTALPPMLRSPTATGTPTAGARGHHHSSDNNSSSDDLAIDPQRGSASASSGDLGTDGAAGVGVILQAAPVPEAEGFAGLEYAGRMRWVRIFALILYIAGLDHDPRWPRGLRWASISWACVLLAHYAFCAVRLMVYMREAEYRTIQLVAALWFVLLTAVQICFLFQTDAGWVLNSVASLSSSSWEVHESRGEGEVSSRRRHIRFDQDVMNRLFRIASLLLVVLVLGNTLTFFALRFGPFPAPVVRVFSDFGQPWSNNRGFYTYVATMQVFASVNWVGPALVLGIMIHTICYQVRRLSDKVRSKAFRPIELAARHKVIHGRALMLTHRARYYLFYSFTISLVIVGFISYRLVVEYSDAIIVLVQLFWLISSAATTAVVCIPAARLTTMGSSDLVVLLSDMPTSTEVQRGELQYAINVIVQRAIGIRLAKTFIISWSLIAKFLSLYGSLLAVLYNMRS